MSKIFGAEHARALRPGHSLGLMLDSRSAEFSELLLQSSLDEVGAAGREWLRLRYAEIVPLVLAPALTAVEHGRPLPVECLDKLRAVARGSATEPDIDLSVVLRGALPALRVFTLVMQAAAGEGSGTMVVAMARASHVAHELGTCWAETWMQHRSSTKAAVLVVAGDSLEPSDGDEHSSRLDLVARAPELDDVEEKMLTLTAYGMSNDEIARATSYSKQAVAWHLGRLMKTWGAPNRTALVSVAFVRGVIRSRLVRRSRRPAAIKRRAIRGTTEDRPATQEG